MVPSHAAEGPLAVSTTRLQASDGSVSVMPEITVWSPWAQQQQQQMAPPQPLGQEQGGHVSHLQHLCVVALRRIVWPCCVWLRSAQQAAAIQSVSP